MGVHAGEASETSAGLVGLDVHRAARVAAVAYGGQVLLWRRPPSSCVTGCPPGASLRDLGQHRLKDLGHPEQIFQLHADGLQGEFPPLRSLENPALLNNLPAQLANFVGRQREVSEVRALVESSRLVTLAGAGGPGKTRLALQVGAELLDGSGDGVWLVELAPVSDEDAVASAICQALGVVPQGGGPPWTHLLDALAPQRVLLVLDNCEHLIGACAKTADSILRHCPRAHLLATSREPLGIGGETIYRVPVSCPSLRVMSGAAAYEGSDAVALFVERARARVWMSRSTTRRPHLSCRCAAGWTGCHWLSSWRPPACVLCRSASLNDRLDQRFRLLTGGSRSALERQQTLRATVEWSYSLLNSMEKLLLTRLSVFMEGFDLEAGEAVCGFGDIDLLDVADLMGSLVDKSLAIADAAGASLRYRLLETIRQFAAERLADAGEDGVAEVLGRHCGYFLSLAEKAAPDLPAHQGLWFDRLDSEGPTCAGPCTTPRPNPPAR